MKPRALEASTASRHKCAFIEADDSDQDKEAETPGKRWNISMVPKILEERWNDGLDMAMKTFGEDQLAYS